MDRLINYAGAIPLETDLLNTNRNTMTAIAKLAAAMFGTGTVVNGLAVTQTTFASMQVSVAPGEIYMLANMDGTAYSSLAADTTHQIMKQGISLDAQLLTLTAPGTVGFSVNYLIEATFTESDTTPVVLPYYNASNPSTAYSGPANAGTTNNTKRQGLITLVAKAGAAATTGTQTTPAPDSGYVGIAVVTVAYGAATVVNANISAYSNAPFINTGMLGLIASLLNSPPQFDNTLKVASTAFVKLAQGNFSGISTPTASVTLTLTQLGSLSIFNGSTAGQTISFPAVATVPSGYGYWLQNVASVPVTIKANAAELIQVNGIGVGSTSANTLTLGIGESTFLVSNGSGWYEQQGVRAATIAGSNSIAANGWRKNADGTIEQWGSVVTNASGLATITYPIAFPTAAYSGSLTVASGGVYYAADFDATLGLSSVAIRMNAAIAQTVYFRIIGK